MSSSGRSRFFYGWVIVAVALVMNIASSPATAVTFGFFIRPMEDDLGWSASELALGLTFRLAVAGITSPMVGVLLDRFGPRILGTAASLVTGVTIAAVGLIDNLWLFYLLYAISGLSGFGGPSGQLLTVVPVAKWFEARRGWALGIASMGTPFGNLLLIPLAQLIIDAHGWRTAWVLLGGGLVLISAPICALFMRKDPESMGLFVDGAQQPQAAAAAAAPGAAPTPTAPPEAPSGWTVRQATGTHVFWLLFAATAIAGLVTQGTLVHRVPFWQDVGIASGFVALGTALAPTFVVTSSLLFGYMADRWDVRNIGLIGGVITGLSAAPMIFATNSIPLLFIHNVLWGFGQGMNNTIANVVWPQYFGRANLGSIRGVIFPVTIGTAAVSAPLFAVLLASASEQRMVWLVTLVGFLASGFLYYVSRPPGRAPAPAPRPDAAAPVAEAVREDEARAD